MKVIFNTKFRKQIKKRFPDSSPVHKQFIERIKIFIKEPNDKILKRHRLRGKMSDLWSISINGDVRAIYYLKDIDTVCFIDIGTHNQVYNL